MPGHRRIQDAGPIVFTECYLSIFGDFIMSTIFKLGRYQLAVIVACISFLTSLPLISATDEGSDMVKIKGEVWYRERIMLPPGAVVKVYLEDVSRQDVAATVIASTQLEPKGGPPFAFTLEYDKKSIKENMRYAIRVRIERGDRLLFINTESVPFNVDTASKPLKVLVSRVGGMHRNQASNMQRAVPAARAVPSPQAARAAGQKRPVPDAALANTYWRLLEIDGEQFDVGENWREPHMVLNDRQQKVKGFAGCNRFMGSYKLNGEQIRFGQVAVTNMMCFRNMDVEKGFLEGLNGADSYLIKGDTLEVKDAEGKVKLKFDAVYLY
jgi:putative lipoprotein